MKFGEYEIVKYSSEYKPQVVALQAQLWGANVDNNIAYFEWKYEQNPFAQEVPAIIALHQGNVVAFRGFFPQKWCAEDGAVMKAFSPADLVVDEAHRRRGLFGAMTKASFEIYEDSNIRFFVNLSSNEKSSPGYLKFGWKPLMERRYLVRYSWRGSVLRLIHHALRLIAPKSLWSFLKRIKAARSSGRVASAESPVASSDVVARADTVFEYGEYQVVDSVEYKFDEIELFCKGLGDGRIAHLHSRDYMKWRFQSPRHNYQFIYLYKAEVLCGYLILARSFGGGRSGHVVDYGVTDEKAFRKLIDVMLKKYKFEVLQWTAYGGVQMYAPLSQAGFKAKQQLSILIRPNDRVLSEAAWVYSGASVMNADRWCIRGIYSDGV